ncbi:hypothetical protein KC349_g7721 [Hortaea werneckii]|nr:hypothetical protein KC349_g7721 [Hortaea werneckii]
MPMPYNFNGLELPHSLVLVDQFDLLGVDPYRPTRHTYAELKAMAYRVRGLLGAVGRFTPPVQTAQRHWFNATHGRDIVLHLESANALGGPDFAVAAFYALQPGDSPGPSTWNPHITPKPFTMVQGFDQPMPRLPAPTG